MIQYNSKKSFYKRPFGAVAENTDLFLRIKTTGDKSAVSAQLVLFFEEDGTSTAIEGIPAPPDSTIIISSTAEKLGLQEQSGQVFAFTAKLNLKGLYFYHFEAVLEDGSMERTSEYQLTVYS